MFDPQEFMDEMLPQLRSSIKGKAIIACSGGVDSTVAAVMVSQALGDRLLTVYVDTGLMRKGETESVDKMLSCLHVNHKVVDASDKEIAEVRFYPDKTKVKSAAGVELWECASPRRRSASFGILALDRIPEEHRAILMAEILARRR